MEVTTDLTHDKFLYSVDHARDRALERYGLKLKRKDIENIVFLIQSGESATVKFMRRQSNYRTVWKVFYGGRKLYVVYNNRHKVVATFLTENMYNNPLKPQRREK